MMIRLHLLTPNGYLLTAGSVQPHVHDARRGDGFLLPDSLDSGGDGEFPDSADDRAKDLAFPKINLISWYIYVLGGLLRCGR